MRGSTISAALLSVGLVQAGPVPPTKTTEDKRSPQVFIGRPSSGLTIPGTPVAPPKCDPRINGICVLPRPPKEKREVDEEIPATPLLCDPRIQGLCVAPRPGTKREEAVVCDPRIHGLCVEPRPGTKRDTIEEAPADAVACDPRIHGICIGPRPGTPGTNPQGPWCDPRILGICVPPRPGTVPTTPVACDPRIQGICVPLRDDKRDVAPPEDSFHLPESDAKRKELIKALEGELLRLQSIKSPSKADLNAIKYIKAYLKELAGIIYITAPDGTVTIFHPGKRSETVEKRQTLGNGKPDQTKAVIKELEKQLQKLQAKRNKTPEDLEQIAAIKAALKYLAGITEITGPAGGSSTFVPGKRQSDMEKAIKELQRQLLALQNKAVKDEGDLEMIAALQAMIKYTQGITQITAPPGVNTTLTVPGNP